MKTIAVCNNQPEAEILKVKLESSVIIAVITADDEGGLHPGLSLKLMRHQACSILRRQFFPDTKWAYMKAIALLNLKFYLKVIKILRYF